MWGDRYIDDVLFRLIDDDPNQPPPADDEVDRRYLVLSDRQFSAAGVVDLNGDIAERRVFAAYSRARHMTGHDVDGDGDTDGVDHYLVSTPILAAPPLIGSGRINTCIASTA